MTDHADGTAVARRLALLTGAWLWSVAALAQAPPWAPTLVGPGLDPAQSSTRAVTSQARPSAPAATAPAAADRVAAPAAAPRILPPPSGRYNSQFELPLENDSAGHRYAPPSASSRPAATPTLAPAQPVYGPQLPVAGPSPPPAAMSAMSAVQSQVGEHLRRGTELGNRRAYYSARAEFVQALRLVAQAQDADRRNQRASQALTAGLHALYDSDDFIPSDGQLEAEMNVALVAGKHRTPVVRMTPESIDPLGALQKYYTYAQDQLALAMSGQSLGSQALFGLGKLYTVMGDEKAPDLVAAASKSLTLHQAALMVDQNNAASANELGVLLARLGRYAEARAWLQHSVSVRPDAISWQNLATVHQRLGEPQLAAQAQQQVALLARNPLSRSAAGANPDVRWLTPQDFARSAGTAGQMPLDARMPGRDGARQQ